MFQFLKANERHLKQVLPSHLSGDRVAWLVVNSIRQTPALAGCTPVSFLNSVMLASNMGLEIRKNSAYLIPYGKECQLLIDYRGKLDLARRAGVKGITLELVREFDEFDYERSGKGTTLRHRPNILTRVDGKLCPVEDIGEVVLGYAIAPFADGEPQIEVMSLAQIEGIRRRAKAGCAVDFTHYGQTQKGLTLADIRSMDTASLPFKSPYRVPWVTDWDQMARKTLMHRICNYIPQSAQVLLSQEVDEAIHNGAPMPVSLELTPIVDECDPQNNKGMVDIPDSAEERKEAQQQVAKQKIEELRQHAEERNGEPQRFATWAEIPDQVAKDLGLEIVVGGKRYVRSNTDQAWSKK